MLGVGYYLSASEWDTSLGMGYPLRLKRVAILIPAQTIWGTRVEEPQVEHGVEVRVREWRRHVNVSKVSQPKHETPMVLGNEKSGRRRSSPRKARVDQPERRRIVFFLVDVGGL